jgi:hypothetical protein
MTDIVNQLTAQLGIIETYKAVKKDETSFN